VNASRLFHPAQRSPALVLQDLEEPAQARPLLERALAIDEKTFGPDHSEAIEEPAHLFLLVYRKHLAWVRGALAEAKY
jgi:hypothetical protein